MRNCEFCTELASHTLKLGNFDFGDRILHESEHFVAFPCIGQLIEGYLLIIPKKHYFNMSQLPKKFLLELENEFKFVKEVLQEHYIQPFFFEHGDVCTIKRAGSCIDHAHIHVVPLQFSMLKHLKNSSLPKRIHTLVELKKQQEEKVPYFFLENQSGNKYICNVKNQVHSQFLRRIIAKEIEKHDQWDWNVFPEFENMKRTINTLKEPFQKMSIKHRKS